MPLVLLGHSSCWECPPCFNWLVLIHLLSPTQPSLKREERNLSGREKSTHATDERHICPDFRLGQNVNFSITEQTGGERGKRVPTSFQGPHHYIKKTISINHAASRITYASSARRRLGPTLPGVVCFIFCCTTVGF